MQNSTTKLPIIVAACVSLAGSALAHGGGGGGGAGIGGGPGFGPGGFGIGGPQGFGPMNNPGLDHMSSQGLTNSDFGRTTAQDAIDQRNPNASGSPGIKRSKHSISGQQTRRNRHASSTRKSSTRSSRTTVSPTKAATPTRAASPQVGEPNEHGPMNNPGLSHMSSTGLERSTFGRTIAEDARILHNPNVTGTLVSPSPAPGKANPPLGSPTPKP
jgi:hypothetical protein